MPDTSPTSVAAANAVLATAYITRALDVYTALVAAAHQAEARKVPVATGVTFGGASVVVQPPPAAPPAEPPPSPPADE